MPTISKVTLQKEQTCSKCNSKLNIGETAVKGRQNKEKTHRTIYYHIQCP